MIVPRRAMATSDVADHYDELDVFYREVWGEHVHHGLWRTGREPAARDREESTAPLCRLTLGGRARGGRLEL